MNRTDRTPESKSAKPRKPYAPPKLVSYGHVKEIIQGNSGLLSDSGTTMLLVCWVAEALYGATDTRTLLLRGWLTAVHTERRPGWRLVELYRVLGPTLAGLIRTRRFPRRAFLPLFDFLAGKAFDTWARVIRDGRHRRTV